MNSPQFYKTAHQEKSTPPINQTGFEKGATFGLFSSHKANVKHEMSNKSSITQIRLDISALSLLYEHIMSLNTAHLKKILRPEQILSDPEALKKYNSDWLRMYESRSELVLLPESHQNVQDIVAWANRCHVPLVPCGGRTGLSGGAVASNKEVMLSFERMNRIKSFDPAEPSLTVEPGVITQKIQEQAKEKGLYFPLSFASEGSSQIGGNVSTRAGGIHVIRYGSIEQWVLGLKLVTGEGKSLSLGRGLVKNTAGYNLLPLFVGMEGTLGLITEITLKLAKSPPPMFVFLLAVPDLQKLIPLYTLFRQKLSLNAFEMFTGGALSYTTKHISTAFPLKEKSPYFVLMECDQKDREQALSLFEFALEKGYITDGTLSETKAQAKELWSFREHISEALSPHSPYKNDISVRTSLLPPFLSEMEEVLKTGYPDFTTIYFGHIGDGNLHINILKPENMKQEEFLQKCEKVNHLLFSLIQKHGGSISAEHGVGLLKKPYLSYSCSQEEQEYMRAMKKIFDPRGLLNPGKIFD